MVDEPKTAFAAFFQMRGRDSISETEFVLEASHHLRWFTPRDAQRLLQIGMDRGLLSADAGTVRAVFDVNAVAVPVNYRPGPDVLTPPPRAVDLFTQLITRIEGTTGDARARIVAQINRVQERLGVDADVAAALVACRLGVDVADVLPRLSADVLRRAR